MQGFFPAIIAVSVFARLIKFSLPRNDGIAKYSSLLLGLCITAVMAFPVVNILNAISDFSLNPPQFDSIEDEYSGIFEENIAEGLYPSVEEYIYRVLEESFSIKKENAEVFIRFNTDGDVIALGQILIFLKGTAVFSDTKRITEYFEEKFICPVDVSVDIP